ncbi:unnamed protein product [Hermetia illucens]|uniref:Envelope protein n=2 Tax=Hermetia illucens TaxID=343691 RepID=A0A7R8V4L8_HERIL|nr:unnamed protein product [Hermetia illucens]
MSEKISDIHQNENWFMSLLKNHTSILDATSNIMKENQETIDQRYKTLEEKLEKCMVLMGSIERTQTAILDMMSETYQGQIGYLVLSPHQFNQEATKIRTHLPAGLYLPVEPEDTLQLYRLKSVEGRLPVKHAIFQIKIPLIGLEEFALFRVFPIWTCYNKTLIKVRQSCNYLAVTAHLDRYYPVADFKLSNCVMVHNLSCLCTQSHSIYYHGASENRCEIDLLNNISMPESCQLEPIMTTAAWIEISKTNKWIYAVTEESSLSIVCPHSTSIQHIEGSVCVTKQNHIILQAHQTHSSDLTTSHPVVQNQIEHKWGQSACKRNTTVSEGNQTAAT